MYYRAMRKEVETVNEQLQASQLLSVAYSSYQSKYLSHHESLGLKKIENNIKI